MKKPVRLMYAASENDADLLYRTRCSVPDPFLWWQEGGRTHAAFSPLEVDRARRSARVDRVWAIEDFLPAGTKRRGAAALIEAVARRRGFKSVEVPSHFPLGLADELKKKRISVRAARGEFFPERRAKSPWEISEIEKALRLAEAGLERGLEVLKASRPGPGKILRWGGKPLTSERLRGEIDAAIIKLGGLPANTIVAGGDQACDPHERGRGPLRAHEAIILDIFPRDQRSGYFGDLTRTVVRGRASDALRKLYRAVDEGQSWMLRQLKPGVHGGKLHRALVERFTQAGFPTEKRKGRWVGFFHGTGHSLGLEIHEPPRFSDTTFYPGLVMTIEPGLYVPGIGGARIEDLVVFSAKGVRNLTRAPRLFEI